jgi:hypothetical protein
MSEGDPDSAAAPPEAASKQVSAGPRPVPAPLRRPLRIFAFDPMHGRTTLNTLTLEVANEKLKRGPRGTRIRVVDYDGAQQCFYEPVNLDDPAILMQNGLTPTESDPRFHQQMVYAVATKVLENFDKALGRRITFLGRRPLTLFPHAFRGANAFYDPTYRAIRFGYFTADREDPGENLPGQNVFTCLSHDIITHEMTHAIVHRLREHYLQPTNVDVLAFHEGFSDIVAIFQHFTFESVLRNVIQRTRTDLRSRTELNQLASQFGYATGKGEALRSATDEDGKAKKPDPKLYEKMTEPHERGSILVAAVFDAFFGMYQQRIEDLLRIATGGTGRLPEGDLHPDLVNRIAREASRTAETVLTMCIRAFEYLPPVDVRYGDYLRALVTADYDLVGEEGFELRRRMINGFRRRGVFPERVASLAEDSLLWEPADTRLPDIPKDLIPDLVRDAARGFRRRPREASYVYTGDVLASGLDDWATDNAELLDLDPRGIKPHGFHSVFRVAPNGELQVELVAQFVQTGRADHALYGGLPVRGGTTVIAAADGKVRYVISKPLPSKAIRPEKQAEAAERIERQRAFVEACDREDPALPWCDDDYVQARMTYRNFRSLHQGLLP